MPIFRQHVTSFHWATRDFLPLDNTWFPSIEQHVTSFHWTTRDFLPLDNTWLPSICTAEARWYNTDSSLNIICHKSFYCRLHNSGCRDGDWISGSLACSCKKHLLGTSYLSFLPSAFVSLPPRRMVVGKLDVGGFYENLSTKPKCG